MSMMNLNVWVFICVFFLFIINKSKICAIKVPSGSAKILSQYFYDFISPLI